MHGRFASYDNVRMSSCRNLDNLGTVGIWIVVIGDDVILIWTVCHGWLGSLGLLCWLCWLGLLWLSHWLHRLHRLHRLNRLGWLCVSRNLCGCSALAGWTGWTGWACCGCAIGCTD